MKRIPKSAFLAALLVLAPAVRAADPIKSPEEQKQDEMRQQWQKQQEERRRQEEEAQRKAKEAYLVLRVEEEDRVAYKVIPAEVDYKVQKRKGYAEKVVKKFPRTDKGKEQAEKLAEKENEEEEKKQKRKGQRKSGG